MMSAAIGAARRRGVLLMTLCLCGAAALGWSIRQPPVVAQTGAVSLAVIGDYGTPGQAADDVAALVAGWVPDAVLTTGDNNYPVGAADTIDNNIGRRYHGFIAPYTGAYGAGADTNRFWPSLGNHEWSFIIPRTPRRACTARRPTCNGRSRPGAPIWS